MTEPSAIAQQRLELLEEIAGLEVRGISLRKACLVLEQSPATVLRWRRDYAAGFEQGGPEAGLRALEPKTANCGRRPSVVLDDEEEAEAKRLYVVTGSKTTALRLLANSSLCREEVAEVILKKRTSKHTLTKSLRAQIDVPQAVIDYHKSPTRVRHNAFINPRTLSYVDAMGTERRLTPGDLFERDDMSNNFLCWVPWPWGGDPCSDRYGVRIARGQNLLMIDVASLYFTSFNFLIRMRDSYRADDIWQWVHHTYQDIGMPRIGERWERGTWASRKLRGDEEAVIEAGHTDETQRLGGMSALGLRVIESQSPTTKIIENRFNFFQTVCSTIRGQIGRKRGEMERIQKIWTACRNGHRDPRDYFLSFDEACAQIEAKLHYCNSEPVEGELYHGIPAQMWAEGIAAQPLKKIDPAKAWLFARDKRTITASKSHLHIRYTRPDGSRGGWWFFHEDLYRYEGMKVSAYFDEYHVESGATLVVAEGRDAGKVLGQSELIAGCPQFALGVNEVSDRDGIERKRGFMDAVRSEYRSIGLGGRTARATRVDDGNGQRVEIVSARRNHSPASGSGDPLFGGAGVGERPAAAGENRISRKTEPLPDMDELARAEAEFLATCPV